MRPLRIIAAGILETAAHLWAWWLEEMADKPHTRTYDAPTAYRDGQPLPRPARVPDVRCTHGHPLDRPCRECEDTR